MTVPATACLALATLASASELTITTDHADGQYRAGETVVWSVTSTAEPATPLAYSITAGGLTRIAAGTLAFTGHTATVSASLDQPGTLLLSIQVDEKTTLCGGAAVDWEHIQPSALEPADFDAFWRSKLGELAAVPADPQLEEVDAGTPGVRLWKLTLDTIGGAHIHGYLARPSGDQPCPAMLQLQWSGYHALNKDWVLGPAKNGWLACNIVAHDLPIDREPEFYVAQKNGPLRDYAFIGNDNRDTSYFLRMYLSCYRTADYLATRADWNRTTLIAHGGSQGGLQAIVTAALHPAVSAVTANVPAGCDHNGASVGRAPGWPGWLGNSQGAERQSRLAAAGYFDVVNFARRIRCPALIGTGLRDTTCPSAGIFVMFNQITAPKKLIIMPDDGHVGAHAAYHAARTEWWYAALTGHQLPPAHN